MFQTAEAWAGRLAGLEPAAWAPGAMEDWAEVLPAEGFDTVWLSDGLAHPGREALAAVFEDKGDLTVIESPRPVLGLHPAGFADGQGDGLGQPLSGGRCGHGRGGGARPRPGRDRARTGARAC